MAKPTTETIDILNVPTNFDAEEQVGFAPYWAPVAGASFIGRVIAKEEAAKETDFTRYLLQAGEDVECARGAADEAEKVTVKKGEFFTISVYFSLQGLFDFYLENKFSPWMRVMAVDERPTKKAGQTVWTWKLQVAKADKAKADQLRAQNAAAQLQAKNAEKPAELSS